MQLANFESRVLQWTKTVSIIMLWFFSMRKLGSANAWASEKLLVEEATLLMKDLVIKEADRAPGTYVHQEMRFFMPWLNLDLDNKSEEERAGCNSIRRT